MKKIAKTWLNFAKSDFESALYLFNGARYPQAIYLGCQSLEKLLKAVQIELTKNPPKKTHRLENLAIKTGLKFTKTQIENLTELSKIYGKIRYPDVSQSFYNTKSKAEPIFKKIKNLYLWTIEKLENH